ncbi:lactonase family protein [Algibacter mikhailovii]|nr:lactonase family protein [Algibacter mikhailovii]
MKSSLSALLVLLSIFNCIAQNTTMYVGTYTSGMSEGIYKFDFNTETGELSNQKLAVAVQNPSFLAFSPNKKYIYAVGEGETGAATAFKLKSDGTLEFINSVSSNGKGPCHISTNKTGNRAVVSNYGGGTVSIYDINKNGRLEKAHQTFNHNIEGQSPARAHSAKFYKDELFVADLGRNRLYQYKKGNKSYEMVSKSIIHIEGNPGPRHFVISQDGNYVYIINEYGGSITSVKRTDTGFEQIDYDSTLEETYKGENKCADIHLSKDERFLYGSNRGENSIAVFKRNLDTGTLDKIQNMTVHGDWPRNFALDPSGKFLLVANQKSNNISVFSVDKNTGELSFLNTTETPSPVCLLF